MHRLVPHQLEADEPVGGPAGSRLLAGVQLPELGVVDRGEVLVDREHELPGPGRRVAGSLLLSRQAGRMLLFPSEDDGPDVTVKEPCDDWLVLTLRAWKDVSRLEYLFTGGHIRQQLIVYSTTEYGEKGFLVDCPHHAEVVRLLLLAQRDIKDACAPCAVALVHVVDTSLEIQDLLVAGHNLVLEVLVLRCQPPDQGLQAVHPLVVALDGGGESLELLGHVRNRLLHDLSRRLLWLRRH